MTNATDWRNIKRLEEYVEKLGFKLTTSKVDYELFAIKCADDKHPLYSRDAEHMHGDADQIWAFLLGWEKSRSYLIMAKATSEKKIEKAEQDYRHEQVVRKLRGSEISDVEEDIPF